jgi:RimJ/RimL family protein N-acetyltransferase
MLKGERVLLRPMRRDDIPRQHEFDQNMQLWIFNCEMPRVSSLQGAESFYEMWTSPDDNMAAFAIEVDGKYIGNCCLANLRNRNGSVEMGIIIGDPAYWGHGYGRETVKLLLKYGFHYLGVRRIVAIPQAKNERAIRSYRACGFVEDGRPRQVFWAEGEYVDVVDMSISREEWLAQG